MSKLFTYGQAIDLAKQGVAVSGTRWGFVDRVSGHPKPLQVEAEKIWSATTQEVMKAASKGHIVVEPYCTKITQYGPELTLNNFIPTNEDMNDTWMLSSTARRLTGISIEEDDFNLTFSLTEEKDYYHFKELYKKNLIGFGRKIVFIAGDVSSNIRAATIYNIMEAQLENRQPDVSYDGFTANLNFLKDGWMDSCTGLLHNYQFINIDAVDLTFANQICLKDSIVIIDKYSLDQFDMSNGENAFTHVRNIMAQLPNPTYHLDMAKELDGYKSI